MHYLWILHGTKIWWWKILMNQSWKFLTLSKNYWIPMCLFCHHHDHHAYCVHATLLSYIVIYSYVARNLIIQVHLHMHCKHKTATPFLDNHRKCVSRAKGMWCRIAVHALNSFQVYQYTGGSRIFWKGGQKIQRKGSGVQPQKL